jgi:hypothetical protein
MCLFTRAASTRRRGGCCSPSICDTRCPTGRLKPIYKTHKHTHSIKPIHKTHLFYMTHTYMRCLVAPTVECAYSPRTGRCHMSKTHKTHPKYCLLNIFTYQHTTYVYFIHIIPYIPYIPFIPSIPSIYLTPTARTSTTPAAATLLSAIWTMRM